MARNPDRYNYFFSGALDMECAEAKDGSHVYTQDGVRYTADEIQILNNSGGLSKKLHYAKKIFNGEIVNGKQAHSDNSSSFNRLDS